MSVTTTSGVIAQVAYASSNVIIDTGVCKGTLGHFGSSQRARKPIVVSIPSNADAGAYVEHYATSSLPSTSEEKPSPHLVSLIALSDTRITTQLLPYITSLIHTRVVLHLGVSQGNGLAEALRLRSAALYVLYSSTTARAKANAIIASRLAEKGLAIHLFEEGEVSKDDLFPSDEQIRGLFDVQLSQTVSNGISKGATNGNANGNANGHTNGHANGNGSANGYSNGGADGLGKELVNGHTNGSVGDDTSSGYSSPSSSEENTIVDPTLLSLYNFYEEARSAVSSLTQEDIRPYYLGEKDGARTQIFCLGQLPDFSVEDVSCVDISLLSPMVPSKILPLVSPSVERIIVLEQLHSWSLKWSPLYLEIMSALQHKSSPPSVQSVLFGEPSSITKVDIIKIMQQDPSSGKGRERLRLGASIDRADKSNMRDILPHVPKHESSYTKILEHIFGSRLEIANAPDLVKLYGSVATTPEFALGRVQTLLDERAQLVSAAQKLLETDSSTLPSDLHALISKWLMAKDDKDRSQAYGAEITKALESSTVHHPSISTILSLRSHLPALSRWIIGSDAWAYDLGASGLHHLIASGKNINMLILDTTPYSRRGENNTDPLRRKRDIGLYAMNHGDVYVASVAVYSSYTQVLQAMAEADRYPGPAIVLAHLPYADEDSPALEVLKETKLAVDTGYWPLYRWDPSKEKSGKESFALDSDAIKQELKDFLDRENHLSQLTKPTPVLAAELVSSLGERIKEARQKRAQQAYADLLSNIAGAPLLVLYASDGGSAEKKAKRLAARGKARGLSTRVAVMDSVTLDELAQEENIAFVTSVAGQGEPPQNGRTLFKTLNATAAKIASSGEQHPLASVKYSVFGMGDSHYWPRAEDAHFYNKAGKDLDARLESLGATRFAELGLGDDQDADGPETGYKLWEPLVWRALGVDAVEVTEAEPDPITNEHMKAASNYLRGTIIEGLEDTSTGALAPSDTQLTKFHGIYQQDDRDIRDERVAEGVEPAYAFMIRVRMPGGVCSPEQWLAMDKIADEHGNGTFKITTRQTYQFHGVIKRHLKQTIKDINRVLLDTLAACGDVNRNVITSAIPTKSALHADVYEFAKAVSERLLPRTTAYHEIWLDKKLVAGDAIHDFEPLYGEFYLPRKFKVAVAVPPTNDVDVFANDVGFIAIVGSDGRLEGFNVTAGGGMGVTHGNKKTYPRLGSILGFCTPSQGLDVAEKIMLVQRDNGNRADRKNARLKYTIDRMGLDVFKAEVEKLLGWQLAAPRPCEFDRNIDDFGWSVGENGKHNFMMFIENGRVQDEPNQNFKTGLRELARVHKGTFRMTTNQHLLIADVPSEELPRIKAIFSEYRMDNLNFSGLRLSSSACVAFPTCGLAMAESERYLPVLINKVEEICEEYGLRNDSIVMRMTGCPNGCARPYVAEVAFVGKAPGTYLMLLGGGYYGQRLNKIYRESVTEPEILAILRPMIAHYARERKEGEHFGDFVIRMGYISATTEGKAWYEGMGGLGANREISVAA